MKKLFYLLSLLLLSACTKEPLIGDKFTNFNYPETQCSDPWTRGTTDSLTLRNLSAYLTARNVHFYTVGIQKTGVPEVCNACTCKTGNTLSVTFLGVNDTTTAEMQRLGFIRLLEE